MKKANFYWKSLFPIVMVLLMGNTVFGQAVSVSSIADKNLAFVLTVPADAAKETTEKPIGPNFKAMAEDFDVEKLSTYTKWEFKKISVSGKAADGTLTEELYYEITNKETNKMLRWSEKDSKVKLVDMADYTEINKKKEGSFDYVQPFKVRMTFWFKLDAKGDYIKVRRCSEKGGSYGISTFLERNPLKLILVER